MTTPLSPTGNTFIAQRTLEDGDALNQAKFTEVFGDAAERTEFLKEHVDAIEGGAKRLRYLSSLASLQAITGQQNGDVAILNDTYLGLYVYDTSFAGPTVGFWVVKPDGFTDGTPGRWRHLLTSFGLGSEEFLSDNRWTIPVPNRLLSRWLAQGTSTLGKTGTGLAAWADVGIESVEFTATTGDFFDVRGHLSLSSTGGAQVLIRLVLVNVTDNTEAEITGSKMVLTLAAGTSAAVPINALVTAGANKNYKVKAQWAAGASDSLDVGPRQLITFHHRP